MRLIYYYWKVVAGLRRCGPEMLPYNILIEFIPLGQRAVQWRIRIRPFSYLVHIIGIYISLCFSSIICDWPTGKTFETQHRLRCPVSSPKRRRPPAPIDNPLSSDVRRRVRNSVFDFLGSRIWTMQCRPQYSTWTARATQNCCCVILLWLLLCATQPAWPENR